MKMSRFTEEQIITILRQAETGEQTIGSVCRKVGISEQTFYRWKKKFAGMGAPSCGGCGSSKRRTTNLSS